MEENVNLSLLDKLISDLLGMIKRSYNDFKGYSFLDENGVCMVYESIFREVLMRYHQQRDSSLRVYLLDQFIEKSEIDSLKIKEMVTKDD